MFTKKQMDELAEYMKTGRVENLNTPDLPQLDLPNWLPKEARDVLEEYVETVSKYKWNNARLYGDMWPHFIRYITTILPAFRDGTVKKNWQEIYEESPAVARRFAHHLLHIENDFDGAVRMYQKHKNEKECCTEMIQKAKALYDIMEEYHCHYYGHMLQENHHDIMEILKTLWENSQQALNEFQDETGDISYLFSDHFPITREFRAKEALPVFFCRKMSLFFLQEFGKPKHKAVADFINAIFDLPYSENEVTKLARKLKPLVKSDHSHFPKK